ncbi:hypothetical protein AM228_16125 [Planktothricoides sp. SR001]|nr:hypothetical protein AM228_16125 [Planktothricoides sp. SR001]
MVLGANALPLLHLGKYNDFNGNWLNCSIKRYNKLYQFPVIQKQISKLIKRSGGLGRYKNESYV